MESNVAHLALSDKLWAWYEANKKPVAIGVVAVLALTVIIWFFIWRHNEKEVQAGQALSAVTAGQLGGSTGPKPELAAAYLKVANDYSGTKASTHALLLAAGSLFTEGKFTEAQTQFDKFRRDHRDSPFMGEALLGIAACQDAQGKTNEAVAAYKELIDRHPADNAVPQARFALARLYEAQNKPEQARSLYEEVERGNPYSSVGSEAGMRLEELKLKFPQLSVPAPSLVMTSAPPALKAPAPAGTNTPVQKK